MSIIIPAYNGALTSIKLKRAPAVNGPKILPNQHPD